MMHGFFSENNFLMHGIANQAGLQVGFIVDLGATAFADKDTFSTSISEVSSAAAGDPPDFKSSTISNSSATLEEPFEGVCPGKVITESINICFYQNLFEPNKEISYSC